ncbi:MAG: hypothetical protein D5S00_07655 [Tindallia sp. MSAO_Bac2]|nr:MAG: hypothetical protein D5S00_07655 [Tindallia sp. MSAO_Bac2]
MKDFLTEWTKTRHLCTLLILSSFIFVSATGCQPSNEIGSMAVQPAVIADAEKELLYRAGAERYFIFDIDLLEIGVEKANLSVDYYENGRFVRHETSGTGYNLEELEQERLSLIQMKIPGTQNEIWHLGFGGSRSSANVTMPEDIVGWTWGHHAGISEILVEEEMVLAVLAGNRSGQVSSTHIVFGEDSVNMEALEEYDVAYVLKLTFL